MAKWLSEGAPAGITVDFQLNGVLEPLVDESPLALDLLHSDHDSFANHRGVEDDPYALAIIEEYIANG